MHSGCKQGRLPKSNVEYWRKKLEKNVLNDKLHIQQIERMGWSSIVLWECELKKDFDGVMEKLLKQLYTNNLKTDKK